MYVCKSWQTVAAQHKPLARWQLCEPCALYMQKLIETKTAQEKSVLRLGVA